jgi:hypothetical protein
MARIRSVKPTFWTDEKIGLLPRDVRLTFLGLISAMADDHGRLPGVARLVRGAVYPFDEDISTAEVERHLQKIADGKLITRYAVNGGQYIHIRNWLRHQKVDRPSASLIPEPPTTIDDDSTSARRAFPTERSGADGMGTDGIESGAERMGARARDPVGQFLEAFYRGATPERIEQVRQQLRDALSPDGARVRKGETVRANSQAHLDRSLTDTIRQGVRDPDKAIVVALKKLKDPELDSRGHTVTEAASDQYKREDKLFTLYHEEKAAAGRKWAKENPDRWKEIEAAVDQQLGNPGAPMYDTIRKTRLADVVGDNAGFPPYEDWLAAREVAAARSRHRATAEIRP